MSLATVSVIVPVYNEAGRVGEVVSRLQALPEVTEIIVVDDGSIDGGVGVADATTIGERIRICRHTKNRGKGAAIRTGLTLCRGEIVVIQDADFEYSPEEIPQLLEPIFSEEAEVAYGSRFLVDGRRGARLEQYVANRFLTWLSNLTTGQQLTDMESGHKAFRRALLDSVALSEDRFGFEPELTAKLSRLGARIVETPVSYTPRTYAEGKKIGPLDGLRALWCILRYSRWD